MAKLDIEICDLESILLNCRQDHTEAELELLEEDLARFRYIKDLWLQFGDIPMDPETECIDAPFIVYYQHPDPDTDMPRVHCVFDPGTHREDIWHWFENTFGLSVAEDLILYRKI